MSPDKGSIPTKKNYLSRTQILCSSVGVEPIACFEDNVLKSLKADSWSVGDYSLRTDGE